MNDNLALDNEKTFTEEIIDLARSEFGIEFDKIDEEMKPEVNNSFFLPSSSKELCDVLWINSLPKLKLVLTYAPGNGIHADLYKHIEGDSFDSVTGVMNVKNTASCSVIFSCISKQINA